MIKKSNAPKDTWWIWVLIATLVFLGHRFRDDPNYPILNGIIFIGLLVLVPLSIYVLIKDIRTGKYK